MSESKKFMEQIEAFAEGIQEGMKLALADAAAIDPDQLEEEQNHRLTHDTIREDIEAITGYCPEPITQEEQDRILSIYKLEEMNIITEEMANSFIKAGKCFEDICAEINRLSEVMPDPIYLIRQLQAEESNNFLKMHGYPMVHRKRYRHQSKKQEMIWS